MYGSECWVWQKKLESKIIALEMRRLRNMIEMTTMDKVKISVIRERCGVTDDQQRKGCLMVWNS